MIASTTHVFRANGACTDRVVRTDDVFDIDEFGAPIRVPTIADIVPVADIMTREMTCASRDLDARSLARLLTRGHTGCVPVVDESGRPVGMVTKLDLVEQLLAIDSPAERNTVEALMMPIAISLGPNATIAHAAAMMASEGIHHVPIVSDDGELIGIVSSMDIVRWLANNDGFGEARGGSQ